MKLILETAPIAMLSELENVLDVAGTLCPEIREYIDNNGMCNPAVFDNGVYKVVTDSESTKVYIKVA